MRFPAIVAFVFGSVKINAQSEEIEAGGTTCTPQLLETCSVCSDDMKNDDSSAYDCSLPGLQDLKPGLYEGIKANYLSFVTETSSPNFPARAAEFEACTGGKIVFSEANNVWEDPVLDLGTKTSRGSEVYDGYFMSYSHFPEVSALGLAEHLNDRIREDNGRLKWEDVLPKVKAMGEYRKDGVTNIDFLMYDGDFFVPLIRLDLLEKHSLALPNTWDEVVDYAKFFNGTDLNDDGDPDDFGFCHFPRLGAGHWDWWWPEALYSTWATSDQTQGTNEGFFFDEETMEPRFGPGFGYAAEVWKDLWSHGSDGCISNNFFEGRCAIGFAPPGCWKGVLLNEDGVSRKDENGNVIWRPTMKDGTYAEPYRFKPFGSLNVVNRNTNEMEPCTKNLCPKAETIPARGHWGENDRASVLVESPLKGQLINRAPFYWSGGLGTMIRKSSPKVRKDMMWDFFAYTNSPDTSVYDVANYASWLDSWRFSQLLPGDNFLQAGWSKDAYEEHNAVMQWALSNEANGAFNVRLPGLAKYTRDVVGGLMRKYIDEEIGLEDLITSVTVGWNEITAQQGTLDQLEIYRSSLGLDLLSEVDLCRIHRDLMDERDPNLCRKYDPLSNHFYIGTGLRAMGFTVSAIIIVSSIGFMLWTYLDRDKYIIKVSQPIFLHIICVGTILMGATIIPKSLDDEVVSENGGDIACGSIPWLLSLGWCFSFSALFSKTKRINEIFHNPNRFKRIKVDAKDVMKPMIILLVSNIIVLSIWTAMSPMKWDRDPIIWEDEFVTVDRSRGGCVSENFWYFATPLIVIDIGALLYAIQQAYVARKISTEFAESEWIALAMSFIMLVAFVGIPVMIIADDDAQASYFVYCCLICVICLSLIGFIFIPKILNRNNTNGREAIQKSMRNISNRGSSDKTNSVHSLEGMEILEHPKLKEKTKEELKTWKSKYTYLERRVSQLEQTPSSSRVHFYHPSDETTDVSNT